MIIKLSLLLTLILSLYLIGSLFLQKFYKIIGLSNQFVTASESILVGLFLFGSFIFIINFFYKINSQEFLFISLFILILFLSQILNYKIKKKHFKNIFIFTVISFPIVLTMDPGYDAGLYHITHQKFIREEKIIFGISNFNKAFGYSSFYEYLSAPLWIIDNLDNLPNLQLIFYISLFLFIYENAKKNKQYAIYSLVILFTIPLWLRYAPIKWGLVDFPFGVVFFLSVLTSLFILNNNNKDETKHFFTILIFLNCLTFFLKPSGFIVGIATLIIIHYLLRKNLCSFKVLVKILIFPLLITFLWLLRGFINTSCLIFPFDFTCFSTGWGSKEYAKYHWDIVREWGLIIFDVLQNNINFSIFNLILILFFLLIFMIFIHNKLIKMSNKINFSFFYLILFSLFVIELVIFNNNTDFSRDQISYEKILIEFSYLIIIFFLYYFILQLFFNLKKINLNNIDNNFLLLLFSLLIIFIWLISTPIPRLGFSFVGCFFATFLCLINKNSFEISDNKKNKILIQVFILLITINYSFFSDYKINKFYFSKISSPIVEVMQRDDYGVRPVKGDQCWDILWCSPMDKFSVELIKIHKYKFIRILNN